MIMASLLYILVCLWCVARVDNHVIHDYQPPPNVVMRVVSVSCDFNVYSQVSDHTNMKWHVQMLPVLASRLASHWWSGTEIVKLPWTDGEHAWLSATSNYTQRSYLVGYSQPNKSPEMREVHNFYIFLETRNKRIRTLSGHGLFQLGTRLSRQT